MSSTPNIQASSSKNFNYKLTQTGYSNEAFGDNSFPTPTSVNSSSSSRRTNEEASIKQSLNSSCSNFLAKKKAEEFERIQASLLDKNWSLAKYSDPLIRDVT